MKKKVAFFTLGCRANQYETQGISEKFERKGYEIVQNTERADVYIINTCSVTAESDKKSRKFISKAKRMNPNAIIGVVGCYSEINKDEVSKNPNVDFCLGTKNKGDIVDLIVNSTEKKKTEENEDTFEELPITKYNEIVRAFIKIEDGCNNRCAYCLIPFARGKSRSRKLENILKEVNNLAKNDIHEIVFSGINLSFYGKDIDETLLNVLHKVNEIDGIKRIRLGSVYPEMFTDEFIADIKNIDKLCPHFHISLQSGCDSVLKRMNRRYTTKEYDDILEKLRTVMPDVSITTDVIVGFPGETDEEFSTTYNYLKGSMLTRFHVFPYSIRKGTTASTMPNQVDSKVKDERVEKLLELSEEKEEEFINKFKGRKMKVLFEQKVGENLYEGHTENFMKVRKKFDKDVSNQIIEVTI